MRTFLVTRFTERADAGQTRPCTGVLAALQATSGIRGVTFDYPLCTGTDIYAGYIYDKLGIARTANSLGVGIRHAF
jgi:hypothetical protein